jgi:hypothetical protein
MTEEEIFNLAEEIFQWVDDEGDIMKVFSLYHHNKFVASFPSREEAVAYGKSNGGEPWDYDVLEGYLVNSPPSYNPTYFTPTHQQTSPLVPDLTIMHETPQINNSEMAENNEDINYLQLFLVGVILILILNTITPVVM